MPSAVPPRHPGSQPPVRGVLCAVEPRSHLSRPASISDDDAAVRAVDGEDSRARFLVARDYNAVGVAVLWLNTSARGFDSADWGGASVAPLPVGGARGPRGMRHA